jgi:hypothetical protein
MEKITSFIVRMCSRARNLIYFSINKLTMTLQRIFAFLYMLFLELSQEFLQPTGQRLANGN